MDICLFIKKTTLQKASSQNFNGKEVRDRSVRPIYLQYDDVFFQLFHFIRMAVDK